VRSSEGWVVRMFNTSMTEWHCSTSSMPRWVLNTFTVPERTGEDGRGRKEDKQYERAYTTVRNAFGS
jgi:hypothetical protein